MTDEEQESSFNEKLRMKREEKGLTLNQAAGKLRVQPMTYWRWEAGKTKPNLANMFRIKTFLGINFDELKKLIKEEF